MEKSKILKDKRIVVLYHTNFGRNDGPPLYWKNALDTYFETRGVMHLQPAGDVTKFGKFDYAIWVDFGEDGLPTDKGWKIPKDMGETIYVCSDAHFSEAGRDYRYNKAKEFDYAFFNQERFLPEYKEFCGEIPNKLAGVLLHAGEPMAYPHFEIIKKYDVCFVGHMQEVVNYNGFTRLDFLHEMLKEFPNFYFGSRSPIDPTKNIFEDASKRFCESKVVLNISVKDDINMRVFEVLSSGSFLLTNNIPTIYLVGENKKHFVTYDTIEEAKELAHYYIEHDEEREEIAKAGHEMFLAKHTYKHRIETAFERIFSYDK